MRTTICLLALLSIGCSGEDYPLAGPASVVSPLRANVAGRYLGIMDYTSGVSRGSLLIVVWLRQSGQVFEGEWTTYQDGTISGTVSGVLGSLDVPTTLSARWTMDAPNTQGGRCAGSGQSNGTAFPIQLTSASLTLAPCASLTNVTWRLEQEYGTTSTAGES